MQLGCSRNRFDIDDWTAGDTGLERPGNRKKKTDPIRVNNFFSSGSCPDGSNIVTGIFIVASKSAPHTFVRCGVEMLDISGA